MKYIYLISLFGFIACRKDVNIKPEQKSPMATDTSLVDYTDYFGSDTDSTVFKIKKK